MREDQEVMGGDQELIAVVMGALGTIVLAGALVAVRGVIGPTTIALLLVPGVAVSAVIGGRGPGLLSAVSAALAFDFFHTMPYLRLTIASLDDAVATGVLAVIALGAAELAHRYRQRHHAYTRLEAAASELSLIVRAANRQRTVAAVLDTALNEIGPRYGWVDAQLVDKVAAVADSVAGHIYRQVGPEVWLRVDVPDQGQLGSPEELAMVETLAELVALVRDAAGKGGAGPDNNRAGWSSGQRR